MSRFIYDIKRTHRCGSLRASNANDEVTLMGWVQNRRDHGGCVFIDLRDREGLTQVVFDPQIDSAAHALAGDLRPEWVLAVTGNVRNRGGNINPRLPTGEIEIAVIKMEVLAKSETPPFLIEDDIDTSEEIRLKYRYLDLRRPQLQSNLIRRHRFTQVVRRELDELGFLELETPFLIKSTPEGARDYVVPSRVHAGKFFALPQSPQIFKQLLMVSGYDRYFQVARCFRDEDLRAERQPEFTQLDIELSFCSPEDVQDVVERLLVKVWKEVAEVEIQAPFPRISYDESMARFGVDAPDLRFGLELRDLTDLAGKTDFKVFKGAVDAGGRVKAINLRDVGDLSRKELDDLVEFVKIYGAKGLAWLKVKEGGEWQSPIAKFISESSQAEFAERLDLQTGDVAVFVADKESVANASLGNLRKHLARTKALVDDTTFKFCWVVDFPAFEWDEDTDRFYAAHHPFTAPHPDHQENVESDPGSVKALAYDCVLNGVEIGGGSIRIHTTDLQNTMFRALGIDEEEAQAKFGFLLDALRFGAPPHGGVALGIDRIMMLICGTSSIRDVIAFPKTQKQTDLMIDAPSNLASDQLEELSIRTLPRGGE